VGEQTAKIVTIICMAHRPAPESFDVPFTKKELAQRQRQLSMLAPSHVADAYRRAHESLPDGGGPFAAGERGAGTSRCVEVDVWKWRRNRREPGRG